MENKENLLEVLKTLFRWKKAILWTCFLAGLGSILLSLTLSNYYQSSTLFYAASEELSKPAKVGREATNRYYYGSDADIDRIFSIANSSELVEHMIKKFDLYKHYEIDTSNIKAPFRVQKEFLGLYEVIKNKYDAIELSIEDKDPKIAAQMANAAREKINQISQSLIKNTQKKEIEDKKKSILEKEKTIITIGDSLRNLRESYRIYSYTQSETLTELLAGAEAGLAKEKARKKSMELSSYIPKDTIAYVEALVSGLENEVENLKAQVNQFNSGTSQVDGLERLRMESTDQLNLDKERLIQLQYAYESDYTALIVIEEARTPILKSRPKRSYIVVGAVFVAFLMSIIGVLVLEAYKDVNWREIVNAK